MALKDIGNLIAETRKASGIRQSDLAAELGMSPATLSKIENGVLEEIGIMKVARLMERLGLDISAKPLVTGYTLEDAMADRAWELKNARRTRP